MRKNRGKLFGAAIGYTFGGPLGALLGTGFGAFVDLVKEDSPGSRQTFPRSLARYLVDVARCDAPLNPAEIDAIRSFFTELYGDGRLRSDVLDRLIDDALAVKEVHPAVCRNLAGETAYEQRLFLVQLGFRVASADGRINQTESSYIDACADHLQIQRYDAAVIRNECIGRFNTAEGAAARPPRPGEAYHLLGVSRGCTDEELIRSYRKLAAMYHPDRVAHLGPDFVALATKRFREIQSAYERIRADRGMPG
jgi:DnaJ like chaperone protein